MQITLKYLLTIFTGSFCFVSFSSYSQVFTSGYSDSLFTEYFRLNSGGWTAGDATISVPIPDGRTIWLFGDSYLEDVDTASNTLSCLFQVRNCMVVQDSVDPSNMTTYIDEDQTGVLRSTFKLADDDPSILWPGHGFVDSDTVFIFLDHVDNETLDNLGIYIARLQLPSLNINSITPLPDYSDIQIGRAVITDTASGYRYIYGNRVDWIVWEPFVARTLIGTNIEAPFQFYTGTGWSFNSNLAVPISDEYVSPGFSVFALDGKFYMLTQENGLLTCGLGREIYILESEKPWGPFTNKKLVYTVEDQFNGYYTLTYNAQAHPSFFEDSKLLASYNLNDIVDTLDPYICPSQCKDIGRDRMDADTYRPKFIRIPLLTTDINVHDNTTVLITPNPVKAKSLITLKDISDCYVQILQSTGMICTTEVYFNDTVTLSSPSIPGFYFLKVRQRNNNVFFLKFIVTS